MSSELGVNKGRWLVPDMYMRDFIYLFWGSYKSIKIRDLVRTGGFSYKLIKSWQIGKFIFLPAIRAYSYSFATIFFASGIGEEDYTF